LSVGQSIAGFAGAAHSSGADKETTLATCLFCFLCL